MVLPLPLPEKSKAEQPQKAEDANISDAHKDICYLGSAEACESQTATICKDEKDQQDPDVEGIQQATEIKGVGTSGRKDTMSLDKQCRSMAESEWDDLFATVLDKYSYKNSQEMEAARVKHETELNELKAIAAEKACSASKRKAACKTSDEHDEREKKTTKRRKDVGKSQKTEESLKSRNETDGQPMQAPSKKRTIKKNKAKEKKNVRQSTPENILLKEDPEAAGTWVQCCSTSCLKWRHLPDCEDPSLLPHHWICSMNPDKKYNSCNIPEVDFDEDDHEAKFVFTKYTEGSVVWAKLPGWPWWPAMIEADPDLGCYMDIPYGSKVPSAFHVVFFDDKVSRAWVQAASIDNFDPDESMDAHGPFKVRSTNHTKAVSPAFVNAKEAYAVPLMDRVAKCGFKARFKGKRSTFDWDSKTGSDTTDDLLQELSSNDVENILGSAELIVRDARKVIGELLSSEESQVEYEELLKSSLQKKKDKSSSKAKSQSFNEHEVPKASTSKISKKKPTRMNDLGKTDVSRKKKKIHSPMQTSKSMMKSFAPKAKSHLSLPSSVKENLSDKDVEVTNPVSSANHIRIMKTDVLKTRNKVEKATTTKCSAPVESLQEKNSLAQCQSSKDKLKTKLMKNDQTSSKKAKKVSKFMAPVARIDSKLEKENFPANSNDVGNPASKPGNIKKKTSEEKQRDAPSQPKRKIQKASQLSRPIECTQEKNKEEVHELADGASVTKMEQEVPSYHGAGDSEMEDEDLMDKRSTRSTRSQTRSQSEMEMLSNISIQNTEGLKLPGNTSDQKGKKSHNSNGPKTKSDKCPQSKDKSTGLGNGNVSKVKKGSKGNARKTEEDKKHSKNKEGETDTTMELGKIYVKKTQKVAGKELDSGSELDLEIDDNYANQEKLNQTKKYLQGRAKKRKVPVSQDERDEELSLSLDLSPKQSTPLASRPKKCKTTADTEEEEEDLDLPVDAAAAAAAGVAGESQAADDEASDFEFTKE